MTSFITQARSCNICASVLPHEPRPVFQIHPAARVLIAAQAPGRKVHESGVPFDDASGERLRQWMGVDRAIFYDPEKIAILPMGFCYPGTASGKGDLPPRPECARAWRTNLLGVMPEIGLTLVIGQYAQRWHLGTRRKQSLTETVRAWQEYAPASVPLPHPSPRNNIWLKQNPWFEAEVIPVLQAHIARLIMDRD